MIENKTKMKNLNSKFKLVLKMLMILVVTIVLFSLEKQVITKADVMDITPNSNSAILMSYSTGDILYEKKAKTPLPPASMTKIMSIIIIMDALKQELITKDKLITTSEYAASMGGSQIFLSVGEQMKVSDLLKSIVSASANDATVALAEAIKGSEEEFVRAMNAKAKELKLENTIFKNATGLPSDGHVSSSYDMALMARHLIKTYPEILSLTSKYEDYVREDTDKRFWLVNTNKLVRHVPGVDGLKTGWTEKAGYCITATMKQDKMRLIGVVMGCSSPTLRTKDVVSMFNYGNSNYEDFLAVGKGTVLEKRESIMTNPQELKLVAGDDFYVTVKKGSSKPNFKLKTIVNEDALKTYKETNIGKVEIMNSENEKIGEIELVLNASYKKVEFWDFLWKIIISFFS